MSKIAEGNRVVVKTCPCGQSGCYVNGRGGVVEEVYSDGRVAVRVDPRRGENKGEVVEVHPQYVSFISSGQHSKIGVGKLIANLGEG